VSFLLDTNVVSEWVKPRPNPGVIGWLADVDEDHAFISVITMAELRRGIGRMQDGIRKQRLAAWLASDLPLRFEGRIVPINATIADTWGRITARGEIAGRPIGAMDALIAATAIARSLTLVTRNVRDFQSSLNAIVNPWI